MPLANDFTQLQTLEDTTIRMAECLQSGLNKIYKMICHISKELMRTNKDVEYHTHSPEKILILLHKTVNSIVPLFAKLHLDITHRQAVQSILNKYQENNLLLSNILQEFVRLEEKIFIQEKEAQALLNSKLDAEIPIFIDKIQFLRRNILEIKQNVLELSNEYHQSQQELQSILDQNPNITISQSLYEFLAHHDRNYAQLLNTIMQQEDKQIREIMLYLEEQNPEAAGQGLENAELTCRNYETKLDYCLWRLTSQRRAIESNALRVDTLSLEMSSQHRKILGKLAKTRKLAQNAAQMSDRVLNKYHRLKRRVQRLEALLARKQENGLTYYVKKLWHWLGKIWK